MNINLLAEGLDGSLAEIVAKKYGNNVIQSAIVYKDPKIRDMDVKGEHVIHPYSFFKNGM